MRIQRIYVGYMNTMTLEQDIIADKQARVDIDKQIQAINLLPKSVERDAAIHYLTNAVMWLGQDLKRLGAPNPYPNSRDVTNTIVDPTADNLKFSETIEQRLDRAINGKKTKPEIAAALTHEFAVSITEFDLHFLVSYKELLALVKNKLNVLDLAQPVRQAVDETPRPG